MAENSNISWTDHSWSPWRGCTKISPGCKNCYASALAVRAGLPPYRKGEKRTKTVPDSWKKPLRWNKTFICAVCGALESDFVSCSAPHPLRGYCGGEFRRARVFFSLADPFDDEVPIEWLADYLKLIHDTPNLDHLLLTKRPENWRSRIEDAYGSLREIDTHFEFVRDWFDGYAPQNVWLGVSCENQEMADKRIPELLQIPAKVHFLSCEPLLSEIDLTMWLPDNGADQDTTAFHNFNNPEDSIHQVIAGGESGPKRREMKLEWMTSLYEQCKAAGVPFFCKQTSALRPGQQGLIPDHIFNTKEFPNL